MMPKNPHNIVANTHASNTGIVCWVRVEGKRENTVCLFYQNRTIAAVKPPNKSPRKFLKWIVLVNVILGF